MKRAIQTHVQRFATALLTERLDPGSAAAAVFIGVFIGIVPIYGLQTLVALGLAVLLGLNKPLTLAATFINNPFLQPFLVVSSIEAGSFLRKGSFQPWNLAALTSAHVKDQLLSWVLGSLVVGVVVGAVAALLTAILVQLRASRAAGLRARTRFVNATYALSPQFDRGFVRWKMRLDRIFGILAAEDLGSGTIVDLGCGYGMALSFAAFGDKSRRLAGCDLNAHRIEVARQALHGFDAEVNVGDVRDFIFPPAGLVLILDVLQYLSAEEQRALLQRCCAALTAQGKLIFRVHDQERGLWTAITMAFDRLLFRYEHAGMRPLMLSAEQYRDVLESAGMKVESRRFRNLLPLAHILFIAGSLRRRQAMMTRLMRRVGRMVIGHPGLVAGLALAMTVFLYANIHNLRTGSDLTDMFGGHDPQWQAASQIGKELGYGNQLFVLIEAPENGPDPTSAMEEMGDRLTADMQSSGLFKQARCGLQEEELLNIVRFYSWNFPSFTQPEQAAAIAQRLEPKQIHQTIRRSAVEFVTPFSNLGANYFVADPLGLMGIAAGSGQGFSQFASFDLAWGSGNRFFSKDHKALLIIAEPNQSAVDYRFAGQTVQWTREHIASIAADPELRDSGLRVTPAGAYLYAEQDHKFIEQNIRRVSMISIVGNLLLCLLVYPRIPMLLLSLLPTSLGILWTTGVASFYPGEVNLISLSFIAILAGLGDDQVVHFFNRMPQEWAKGGTLNEAMLRSFETTGVSIVLCIFTAAVATAALATSGFKALAEFGFILTVGMFMMMFHTLLTVPALMQLWGRISKPRAPETITFRVLPMLARKSVDFVGRHARLVVASSIALFLLSIAMLPFIHMGGRFEIAGGVDNPAVVAQNRLSAKFGIEGSPNVLLIAGGQEEVLRRAEQLTAGLETYRHRGALKSVFSPSSLVPSARTQQQRDALLAGSILRPRQRRLEDSLREDGFQTAPHKPYLDQLRKLGKGAQPVTVETASALLPPGLLDNSIRKIGDGSYVAAIAYYATDPG